MLRHAEARRVLPLILVLTFLMCALTWPVALAQSAPQAFESPRVKPVPLSHYYWHFFRHEAYLEQEAALLAQQGKVEEADRIRTHLQRDLQLTNAQYAIVRRARVQMLKDIRDIWAKAMPIIQQDQQWLRLYGPSAGSPPGHAQAHELQKQQEAAMTNDLRKLNRQLGPEAAARLQAYIGNHVSARVTHPPRFEQNPANDHKISSEFFHQGVAR